MADVERGLSVRVGQVLKDTLGPHVGRMNWQRIRCLGDIMSIIHSVEGKKGQTFFSRKLIFIDVLKQECDSTYPLKKLTGFVERTLN